ncbi:quinoprotein dehydrogenase-associated SoxYZ-like carrier [Isoalcanivorax beigongshangi]|uniref:Quinoprotein dehydrogenase-associated SoxYZ-like carrier n=1 Tax=Isoalcanivorax beigongshangi TaxID=3238810 RepID=A0ABV4AJN4_9GAMM
MRVAALSQARWLSWLLLLLLPLTATAADAVDPEDSFMWAPMRARFLGDTPYRFDPQVKVRAPEFAEDAGQVPVDVDASALGQFERLLLWVELNPIPLVLDYRASEDAVARLSINLRLERGSLIRSAVLKDGVWHVGSTFVDAAGGGCTTPGIAKTVKNWSDGFGTVQVQRRSVGDQQRVKVRIQHPMDSGLIPSESPFYIEHYQVLSGDRPLADLIWHASISENPTLTLAFRGDNELPLRLDARDNNGNLFEQAL